MTTINQLSEVDALENGDQFPLFSEAQGDTRKVNFLTLKDSVATEFVSLAALAAQTGAGLVGTADGTTVQQKFDTVEDGIFISGRATPIVSSKAQVQWVRDQAGATYPPEDMGGLWTDKVYYSHAVNAEFDATNAPVNSALQSPAVTFLATSHNEGTDAIVVPIQGISGVHANGKEAANANFITYSSSGTTNVKLKGVEIDLQPAATSTISEAFGLAINAFTMEIPGPAIYIEGIFGGKWSTGVQVGQLSNNGAALSPAPGTPTMGTLVDTGTATYVIDAIKLNNTHKVRFNGTASAHAKMYVDGSNFWHFVLGSNSLVIRDNTDTNTLVSFTSSGDVNLEAGGVLRVSSTKVVGARETGFAAMTGTPNKGTVYDTSTVTLAQLAGRVASLQAALTTHGLIGA